LRSVGAYGCGCPSIFASLPPPLSFSYVSRRDANYVFEFLLDWIRKESDAMACRSVGSLEWAGGIQLYQSFCLFSFSGFCLCT